MMYPFMTLPDDTEIVHSEIRNDGSVKIYIETPDENDGFHHATCYLPSYKWTERVGYTDDEMEKFCNLVRNNAHLIMTYAGQGGILNAAAV